MSLLTPIKVPVKVYKWDDVGAPVLNKSAGCMMSIFKACLVTGYGAKTGAGWTMPFGDTSAGVKVLRPEVSPHTDFYLRVSADTGTEMAAQVYLNMTDASTGDLKLQCDTAFKYAKNNSTGKWLLIASPRGFWFFCEQRYQGDINKSGAFFCCGDTAADDLGDRAVYLQHTGGTYVDGDYSSVFGWLATSVVKSAGTYLAGRLLVKDSAVATTDLRSIVNGSEQITNAGHLAPAFLINNKKMNLMPGLLVPFNGGDANNFAIKDIVTQYSASAIAFGTGGRTNGNVYIATDNWSY